MVWGEEGGLRRRGYRYTYGWLIQQKPTQHCKAIILQLKNNSKRKSQGEFLPLSNSRVSRPSLPKWGFLMNQALWLHTKERQTHVSPWHPNPGGADVVESLSHVRFSVTPWTTTHQAPLSTISQSLLKLISIETVMPSNHLILSSSSPPALNFPQHQGLFQKMGSLHQVAKVLELQHQSFKWIFRTDFL